MTEAQYTLTKPIRMEMVGDCTYVAQIFEHEIIVMVPYVKWEEWEGYAVRAESKHEICDKKDIDLIRSDVFHRDETTAWRRIGACLKDDFLIKGR